MILKIWESKKIQTKWFQILDMENGARKSNMGNMEPLKMGHEHIWTDKNGTWKKLAPGQDLAQDLEPDIVFNEDPGIWSELQESGGI